MIIKKIAPILLLVMIQISCQNLKLESNNQAELSEIALNHKNVKYRKAALELLTSQGAISNIAVNHSDPEIRIMAINKLKGEITLSHIAINDSNYQVRIAALNRITNYNFLNNVKEEAIDPMIKALATKKSEELKPKQRIYSPRYF